jgi:hypothetical protein
VHQVPVGRPGRDLATGVELDDGACSDRLDDIQAEDREEEPDRERQSGDDGIALARRLDERLEPPDPEDQVLEACDQHGERQEEQADPQEEPRPSPVEVERGSDE